MVSPVTFAGRPILLGHDKLENWEIPQKWVGDQDYGPIPHKPVSPQDEKTLREAIQENTDEFRKSDDTLAIAFYEDQDKPGLIKTLIYCLGSDWDRRPFEKQPQETAKVFVKRMADEARKWTEEALNA